MNNTKSLFKHYMRGLEELEYISPSFAHFARILGVPQEGGTEYPTAAVVITKNNELNFYMNESFVSDLNDNQVAGVIAHEAYHIFLDHHDEINAPYYKDNQSLIQSQECIINDSIEVDFGLTITEDVMRGVSMFNQDFAFFSTREGYDFIMNKKDQNEDDSNESDSSNSENSSDANDSGENSENDKDSKSHSCGGIIVEEGADLDKFNDFLQGEILDTVAIHDVDLSEMNNSIVDFADQITDGDFSSSSSGANDTTGSQFVKPEVYAMKWKSLIDEIDPKILSVKTKKSKRNWTRPNRRYMDSYPNVILPSKKRDENAGNGDKGIPHIIVALDLSFSIPHTLIPHIVSLAETMPQDKVKSIAVTWSSTVVPYDPESKKVVNSCGTLINELIDWVNDYDRKNNVTSYVICVTDGKYYLHNNYNSDNWHFVGLNSEDVERLKGDAFRYHYKHIHNLEDYINN